MIQIHIKIEEHPDGISGEFHGPPGGDFCTANELAMFMLIRDAVSEIFGEMKESKITLRKIGSDE